MVFRCLSQLSIDEVEAGHCCFERPELRGHFFLPKFESAAQFFPPTQRRIVHWSPFPVSLETFSNYLLQFERFLLHYWSFKLSNAACDHPPDYGTLT